MRGLHPERRTARPILDASARGSDDNHYYDDDHDAVDLHILNRIRG